MCYGPFETFLNRRSLLANELRKIPNGGRVKVNEIRARDHVESGKLCTPETGDEWSFGDADRFKRQWSKERGEHSQRICCDDQSTFSDALVFGEIDRSDIYAVDLCVFAAQATSGEDREIA